MFAETGKKSPPGIIFPLFAKARLIRAFGNTRRKWRGYGWVKNLTSARPADYSFWPRRLLVPNSRAALRILWFSAFFSPAAPKNWKQAPGYSAQKFAQAFGQLQRFGIGI